MIISMLQRRKPRLRPSQGHRVAKKQVMGLSKVWPTPGCTLSWIPESSCSTTWGFLVPCSIWLKPPVVGFQGTGSYLAVDWRVSSFTLTRLWVLLCSQRGWPLFQLWPPTSVPVAHGSFGFGAVISCSEKFCF